MDGQMLENQSLAFHGSWALHQEDNGVIQKSLKLRKDQQVLCYAQEGISIQQNNMRMCRRKVK